MTTSLVYITAENANEARKIAEELVKSGLAACANIMDNMHSIYRWKGKVEEANETVIILKTKTSLVDSLTDKVKSMHSYECPCVVSFPIENGNDAFIQWIRDETV